MGTLISHWGKKENEYTFPYWQWKLDDNFNSWFIASYACQLQVFHFPALTALCQPSYYRSAMCNP